MSAASRRSAEFHAVTAFAFMALSCSPPPCDVVPANQVPSRPLRAVVQSVRPRLGPSFQTFHAVCYRHSLAQMVSRGPIALVDSAHGTVIVPDVRGYVGFTTSTTDTVALDAHTGAERWRARGIGYPIAGDESRICGVTGTALRCVESATGREIGAIGDIPLPEIRERDVTHYLASDFWLSGRLAGDTLILFAEPKYLDDVPSPIATPPRRRAATHGAPVSMAFRFDLRRAQGTRCEGSATPSSDGSDLRFVWEISGSEAVLVVTSADGRTLWTRPWFSPPGGCPP